MGGLSEAHSTRFYDSFLFLNSSFVYLSARYWFSRHSVSDFGKRALLFLGSLSFGVMLFEEITRSLTHFILARILLRYAPDFPMIDAILWISIAFSLGLVLTYLIKKIPYFRKLI